MTYFRRLSDTLQPGEWTCRACGCINEDERCWSCGADQDGEKALDNDDSSSS